MMKRQLFAALIASTLLASPSWAQVNLGGAVSGAINGATGGAQAAGSQAAGTLGTGAQAGGTLGTGAQAAGTQAASASGNLSGGANVGTQAGTQAGINAGGNVGTNATGSIAPGTATAGGSTTAGVSSSGGSNSAAGINSAVGGNASGSLNQGQTQSWLGQVGNDIRGALQQTDNGVMRLQDNLNPALQQRGFQPGDQLLGANGQPLTQTQFDQYLQSNPSQVRVLRNGQTIVLNGGTQGNLQGGGRFGQQFGSGQQFSNQQYSNQSVGQAYGQMGAQGGTQFGGRQRFGITMRPSNSGVFVSSVTVGSPASQAGIRPGDQIISVNGQQITDPNSMIQVVNSTAPDESLNVQFSRNGQAMQSQVTLASNQSSQGGVYQAGYSQRPDNFSQGGDNGSRGDMNSRLDRLEQMIEDLRDQVDQLSNPGSNSDSNSSSGNSNRSQAPSAPRPADQ